MFFSEPELHEVEDTDDEEGVDVAEEDDEVVEIDPVAASMARTQRMLAQFQAQQHAEAEEIRASNPHHRPSRGELEEDDELARAIRESQQMHEAVTSGGASAPHHGFSHQSRVYDDDDEQLQAALKASLESMPEGFVVPPTPPRPNVPLSRAQPAVQSQQNAPPSSAAAGGPSQESAEDDEEEDEELGSAAPSSPPPGPAASVDVEEMRRRRLAKFGG
jgi:Ataxin-3